ncbi:MAG: hypothetical protein M3256_09075, partial [Actinomycetota bacterium]|nr:hypothetical protein [Actinomycetota bacterium]
LETLKWMTQVIAPFLEGQDDPNNLDTRHIDTLPHYLRDKGGLDEKGIGKTTSRQVISFAKSVWKWAAHHNMLTGTPFDMCHAIDGKYDSSEPPALSLREMHEIIKELPPRWRCAGTLFLLFGVRFSEALGIRLCDVDLDRRMIYLGGQGGVDVKVTLPDGTVEVRHWKPGLKNSHRQTDLVVRTVPIPECLVPVLLWQIKTFHSDLGDNWHNSERLLMSVPGCKDGVPAAKSLTQCWKYALIRARRDTRKPNGRFEFHPHFFRKCISTILQAEGVANQVDGSAISLYLGHKLEGDAGKTAADITTSIYRLRKGWNRNESVQAGLLQVAEVIDKLVAKELPRGLFSPPHTALEPGWMTVTDLARDLKIHHNSALYLVRGPLSHAAVRQTEGKRNWLVPESAVDSLRSHREGYLTTQVAAAWLQRPIWVVYGYIADGTLKAEKNPSRIWEVDRQSLHELSEKFASTEKAEAASVSLETAAERLHCTVPQAIALRDSGHLDHAPLAPWDTVTEDSLARYESGEDNVFVVRPARALSILGVDLDELMRLSAIGEIEVTPDGMFTTRSIEAHLVRRIPRKARSGSR